VGSALTGFACQAPRGVLNATYFPNFSAEGIYTMSQFNALSTGAMLTELGSKALNAAQFILYRTIELLIED
jgi:hypothetical protein